MPSSLPRRSQRALTGKLVGRFEAAVDERVDVQGIRAERVGRELAVQHRKEFDLAGLLGTINYEVVTAISQRVPRIAV